MSTSIETALVPGTRLRPVRPRSPRESRRYPQDAAEPFDRMQATRERLDQRHSRNVEPPADEDEADEAISWSELTHRVALVAPIAEAVIAASASAYYVHGDYVTHLRLGLASGQDTTTPTTGLMRVSGSAIRKIRCVVVAGR